MNFWFPNFDLGTQVWEKLRFEGWGGKNKIRTTDYTDLRISFFLLTTEAN